MIRQGLPSFIAQRAIALLASAVVLSIFAVTPWLPAAAPAWGASPAGLQPRYATGSAAVRTPSARAGILLLRPPGGTGYGAARRLGTDVDVDVTGVVARAVITQRFRNTREGWAEGLFVFAVPQGVSIDGLRLETGGRTIESRIAPLTQLKARRDPAAAASAGPRRPRLLTLPVANIGPGDSVTVRLEYQQELRPENGKVSLRVPLDTTQRSRVEGLIHGVRYGADGPAGRFGPDVDTDEPASLALQVRLQAGAALGEIASASHEISVRRTGETAALLALAGDIEPGSKDFELSWTLRAGKEPWVALFGEQAAGVDHVLTMIAPPGPGAPARREVIYLVDTSASMPAAALAHVKASLRSAVSRLGAGDSFNIIRFDDAAETLFPAAARAAPAALARAHAFIDGFHPGGGTSLGSALSAALHDPDPATEPGLRQVVLITGGALSQAADFLGEVAKKRGRSRLFIAGMGAGVNGAVLRRAAEMARGRYLHLAGERDPSRPLDAFLARLERPLVTNLKATWSVGAATDPWPDPLPDLYAGEPVLVSARVPAATGTLTIEGEISGRPWKTVLKLSEARNGSGVARWWARRRIASLEARRFAGQPAGAVDAAIADVALGLGIVSPVTALVAVDGDVVTPVLPPIVRESQPKKPLTAAPKAERPAGNPAGRSPQHVSLAASFGELAPRAGNVRDESSHLLTFADRVPSLALLVLFFVAMSSLTLGLWRHLRREYASLRRQGRRI